MSTHSNVIGAHGAAELRDAPAKGFWRRLFDNIVKARQAQARLQVQKYLDQLNEQQRKDLGYPSAGDRR